MPYYRSMGDVPRKRHLRGDRYEEVMGEEGFSGESSILYHLGSPSALLAVREMPDPRPGLVPNHPLLPRHIRTSDVPGGGDAVLDRRVLLGNDDVVVGWVVADRTSAYYRNAVGDEVAFVQSGRAVVESVFGHLVVGPGDYVVVPRSATHRWVPDGTEPLALLVVESRGHVRPPKRYLSPGGQFLEQAPYCERDVRGPELVVPAEDGGESTEVVVRTGAGLSVHTLPASPFDVTGWAGCLYPWAFSIHDFEPIVGAIHQPPHVHQTFEGPGFVVCSFVPRPYDFHAGAIKVPYHHANVDSDEVIFYSAGDFMSRAGSGIGVGSISLHPNGFVHGPQPGSMERAADQDRTEEVAVMIDTFRPLSLGPAAVEASDDVYPWTWARQ